MNRLIIVAGCHRSGTSLVAKSLTCLGAELGPAAEWSGPDNPTGFWEHQGVLAVNEKVLSICTSRWDDPPGQEGLAEICRTNPQLIYLRGGAEHMLRRELSQYPIFAIKDPRLCVLLPFWRPILAGLGCEVSVVRVVRHPNAVADSLQRRDRMVRDKALRLWLRYAEGSHDPWLSVTVDYDAMVADPVLQLCRIGSRLGLTLDLGKGTAFATQFVDERLWHESTETALPTEVNIVWQQMQRQATESPNGY